VAPSLIEQQAWQRADLERLAVEYEARANPVWPMPGLEECLRALSERGLLLGVVSNGQFYTRELFAALLGRPAEFWGFDPDLQYYSYEHGRAKPGVDLYRRAAAALAGRGVEAAGVLSVGNDLLNDVRPSALVGFRTALFAGDQRSLRLREGDPRLQGIAPDMVLTALAELPECLLIQ
jgi:putative hydrolase of the HAD superfamily